MNCEQPTKTFLQKLIAAYIEDINNVDQFYIPGAKLCIASEENSEKIFTSEYGKAYVNGERKILRVDARSEGEYIIAHFSGWVHPNQYLQSNEMIVFTKDYKIFFHSIHLSPMPDPILEEPKTANEDKKTENLPHEAIKDNISASPKISSTVSTGNSPPIDNPIKEPSQKNSNKTAQITNSSNPSTPCEVSDPSKLFSSRSCLVNNLPFDYIYEDILDEFEVYGTISRYCCGRGKMVIEFENPSALSDCLYDGDFEWEGRTVRVSKIRPGFSWF